MYTTLNEDAWGDAHSALDRFRELRARRDARRSLIQAPSTSHEVVGSWEFESEPIARRAKDQGRSLNHQINRIGQLEDVAGILEATREVLRQEIETRIRGEASTDRMLNGLNNALSEHAVQLGSAGDALLTLVEKVDAFEHRFPEGGQNKSAALKRDMKPVDAERCIRDPRAHQVVADELGLTYAQVYSCRLEYTFKEVHHRLRKEGFQALWTRPGPQRR